MKNIDIEIIKNKNKPDLLLKNGTMVRLREIYNKDDVRGIILGSGKIVSLNVYGPFKFSESDFSEYPKERMKEDGSDISNVYGDNNGLENTDYLNLFCNDSEINAINCFKTFNEYLPSFGEMLEVIREKDRINRIRNLLGLRLLGKDLFYWTSTIRNSKSVWCIHNDGNVVWSSMTFFQNYFRVLSFIDTRNEKEHL